MEDRAFWAKAANVSRELFFKVTGPQTGLSPERSSFEMTPIPGWDGKTIPFSYDSWRTVSNWSVDYSWWHKDPNETVLSDRVQRFLAGQGISMFVDQYTLEGKPLSTRHSTGMLAAATVGGLAATPGANEKAFVEELWRTPIPVGDQRYFDGMLYMMSLLHCSGEFRVIEGRRRGDPEGSSERDAGVGADPSYPSQGRVLRVGPTGFRARVAGCDLGVLLGVIDEGADQSVGFGGNFW